MKKSIGNYNGEDLYLRIASYQNNGRIFIGIDTEEESYSDLTINLSDAMLPDDDYIFINGDMTNELRSFLEEKNIIGDVFTTIQYNMGRYDMVKVDFDVLKEYDPEGFNKYIKKDDKELDM